MAWVVDTCILIDIADADPAFAAASASMLDSRRTNGLIICPVSYVELSPVFDGDNTRQDLFLHHLQVVCPPSFTSSRFLAAHAAWNRYVQSRRRQKIPKRPVADVLIGAFAEGHDGLITRNPADFRQVFPTLNILSP